MPNTYIVGWSGRVRKILSPSIDCIFPVDTTPKVSEWYVAGPGSLCANEGTHFSTSQQEDHVICCISSGVVDEESTYLPTVE
jgi:hypothetical protein